MRINISKFLLAAVFAAVFSLTTCSSISTFSQYAYEQATSLKVESLDLMDKAVEDYADHQQAAEALQTNLQKALEYSKGRPDNEFSTRQWEILLSPDRNLLGYFLKRWKDEGKLSPAYTKEAKGLVSDAFDTIIGLESGKIKPSNVKE